MQKAKKTTIFLATHLATITGWLSAESLEHPQQPYCLLPNHYGTNLINGQKTGLNREVDQLITRPSKK